MKFIYLYLIMMYTLRDWIDEKQLTRSISINERAVEYLENHEHLIDKYIICYNENAIHIIEKMDVYQYSMNMNKNLVNFLRNNRQYMNYDELCGLVHGIEFVDELIKNNELNKINWNMLSLNPAAMHILNNRKYYNYIKWRYIICNPNAGELVKNNLNKVEKYWKIISAQPHLIDIIEQNMDKIDLDGLSKNYNAIHILEKHIDMLDETKLSYNKNSFNLLLKLRHEFKDAVYYYKKNIVFDYFDYCEKNNISFHLIKNLSEYGYTEKHMEFLRHNNNYAYLSKNQNIFVYDYKRMRDNRQSLPWYNDIKK